MRVILPDLSPDGDAKQFRPATDKEGMILDFKNGKTSGLREFVNRQPKWNDVVQAFVLNFYGRVDKPSVKNFQLIDPKEKEEVIYLQFGRVGDDMFNLDFMHPLTPLQAFQISLSSFDYKFACE